MADEKRRLVRLRAVVFRSSSELSVRRRTTDWLRLIAAAVVLVVLARHVDDVTTTERTLFELFNTLPGGLLSTFEALYRLGVLWVLALLAGTLLLAGRWRLARDLFVAGVLAWGSARVIGELVVGERSLAKSLSVVTRAGVTPSFPLVRLAIFVAVVAAARPYVTAPTRRVGQVLVVVMAAAALYLGRAFPNDAFAAIVLGWGVAALVHLVFGSPGGRPTLDQVDAALRDLGISARELRYAPRQPAGSTVLFGEDDGGPLWVTAIGRDELDAQLVSKVARFMIYKEPGPRVFLTRLQQVVHEAYLALLARTNDVRVPAVLVAGRGGPDAVVLVERPLPGVELAAIEPELVTDEALTDLWDQVRRLHEAHIVHGALGPHHVLIDGPHTALIDLSTATSWSEEPAARDVAELLVTTAAVVGPSRAVAAAVAGLGVDAVVAALPRLQTGVLTSDTREFVAAHHDHLDDWLNELRTHAATVTGIDPPALERLERVRRSSVLLVVGTAIAIVTLLGEIGDPGDVWRTVIRAEPTWLLLAVVCSLAANLPYAVTLMGSVPIRLPLWTTTEVQIAMSFSNLAIPGVGGIGVQIRYLQKQGMSLPGAVAAGGLLNTVSAIAVQAALFAVSLALAPNSIDVGNVQASSILELALGAALMLLAASAVVVGIPRLRRSVVPALRDAVSTLWRTVRSPQRLLLLIIGNIGVALLYTLCLIACLQAYGATLSFWTLLALSIAVNTLAQLVPLPGGGTAVASIGLAGALIAFGVPKNVAVATALTNQLIVAYLPALPGWLATTDLIRRHEL